MVKKQSLNLTADNARKLASEYNQDIATLYRDSQAVILACSLLHQTGGNAENIHQKKHLDAGVYVLDFSSCGGSEKCVLSFVETTGADMRQIDLDYELNNLTYNLERTNEYLNQYRKNLSGLESLTGELILALAISSADKSKKAKENEFFLHVNKHAIAALLTMDTSSTCSRGGDKCNLTLKETSKNGRRHRLVHARYPWKKGQR